jgi:Flp pilus assembly CpaF family ATPase
MRWILLNRRISVIHCSTDRCADCPERTEVGCQKLNSLTDELDKTIVFVESTRGLIHLWFPEANPPSDAPWYSEGWESVFIGINNEIFDYCCDLIDVYLVGPYLCIFLNQHDNYQVRFDSRPLVRTSLELSLLNTLVEEFRTIKNPFQSIRENASSQQNRLIDEISKYLQKHIPEINKNSNLRLSQIAAHSTSILGPLVPILSDELTEEVYLDGPEIVVYFDHQKYGRCITSIVYARHEIPRIITFIRAESNQHLDRANPSLKMELDFVGTALRLSASVPPLSLNGLSLEIRRARRNPYSMKDLIQNGTITPEAAALLILAVVSRLNITITGGSGTGKTTLLNALDMLTPQWWRKIYIEDAIESKSLSNQHQVKLQVDPVDEQHKKLSKSEEIVKCLHRSPDYLILGEIQTAEHSQALFQAISAGLRTIQTCHSDSASSLVSRWILSHGIESSNLGMMDLIVTLERPRPSESSRRVKEIVEIRKEIKDGLLIFLGTNTLYEATNGNGIYCAQDGAIQNLARSFGIKEYQKGIESLTEVIRGFSETMDFEKIGEKLWAYGHPMKFTGYQSK